MKRKTKITISALAVMFVAAIAVAIASFSFAGGGKGDDLLSDSEIVADASANVSDKTIIDYIIENSNSTDEEVDKIYHIAEITSGSPSNFKDYCAEDEDKITRFKKYVIDGNKTIDDLMKEGCVEFRSFKADVSDADSLKYISNADFIYVSNDKTSQFSKSNDMSEKLYDVLHTYALGDYKPLVIDSPNATSINDKTDKNMKDLAADVFGPSEKYYYTFKWNGDDSEESAGKYLSHNDSLYLGINGQTQVNNGVWFSVYASDPTVEGASKDSSHMARILTITEDTSAGKTQALLKGMQEVTELYDESGNLVEGLSTKTKFYEMSDGSLLQTYAYNNRVKVKPKYIQNDIVTLADSEAVDFDQYDMIVLEKSCNAQVISSDLYKKFAAAMYAKIHIVYGSDMGTATTTTVDKDVDMRKDVYSKLFYMVASEDYSSLYDNVMVTTRADFDLVVTSASSSTAKVIADLINASKYRGIGGRGSSSSSFTVLELQPCYPIDEEVAVEVGVEIPRANEYRSIFGSGNYYTKPISVVNGKTKEQLEDGTEYYAWELSKAKLSDALGISIDKIELRQMSTEEFACDKTEIFGNYDLIYIGGNTSALKDIDQYLSFAGGLDNSGSTISNKFVNYPDYITQLPIYTMYTHSGEAATLDLSPMGESGGSVKGGTPLAKVSLNGQLQDTFTLLNGNDITYSRYEALDEYISKGMPVVISKELTNAYNIASSLKNPYLQNSIDPDSNMYKVLTSCKKSKKDNIVWNFNENEVENIDSDGTLGTTLTGRISVFKTTSEVTKEDGSVAKIDGPKRNLIDVYSKSTKRPKMTLTSMPATYNRLDDTSKLTDGKLAFKYNVSGTSNYTVKLYIDDDGNSKFDRKKEYMATGDAKQLVYQCASDFYGPLYWMIELTDSNGLTTSQTGICYVKNKTTEKQQVSVLQIMPAKQVQGQYSVINTDTAQGSNSLYFCTVCQQAYKRLDHNPYSNAGDRTAYGALYGGNFFDSADGYLVNSDSRKVYVGKHEHTFGIVRYDSGLAVPGQNMVGMDDWDDNLADQVSDLYDFDVDIMLRDEYEKMARDVNNAIDYVVDENGNVTTEKVTDEAKKAKIASFKIDESDTSYAQYNGLKTDDERYAFIMKREYSQKASEYYQLYQYMQNENASGGTMKDGDTTITKTTKDAKEALDNELDKMIKTIEDGSEKPGTKFSASKDTLLSELNRIKKMGRYYDYYSINNMAAQSNDVSKAYLPEGESMDTYMTTYYQTKDKELLYKELYKKYTAYAAGGNWLSACYSSVIIGPSEDFGGDDITDPYALADLETYIDDDKGQTILFHDTLTKFSDNGSSTLTKRLRSSFGMDRYHMGDPEAKKDGQYYVNYTTTGNKDVYFMTNLSTKTGDDKYDSWYNDVNSMFSKVYSSMSKKYLTDVAYTDGVTVGNSKGGSTRFLLPYKYAEIEWKTASFWYNGASFTKDNNTSYGTDRASQNNQGIVTMFPFTLASELYIAGTHPQAYALDIEDENMTVWYSLAGGSNTKDGSSLFAASPRDGMDNYFIYTYGNVNYCGAGHTKVTGVGKDNNDERYLYINIICNSVRKSVKQPTIEVYDYGKDTNNVIKRDADGSYYTKVDDNTSYPDFSFKVTIDQDVKLSNVKIFYDLDYTDTNKDNAYVADDSHILIADWSTEDHIKAGEIRDVYRYHQDLFPLRAKTDGSTDWETEKYIDDDGNEAEAIIRKLKLQPSYFAPYNNEYTYLVIEATDSAGNKVYQRVKIMIKPTLFDLT